ncbi:hypothetical protein KAR48_10595 [bacterium]|nr:hypothetical protein [bacterium]
MKRFIKTIMIFAFFTVIVYPVLLAFWGDYAPYYLTKTINYKIGSYGHLYSRLQNIKEVKDVDILFVGSSHAYRGFDTRIFQEHGLSSFNLGSSAQTPLQTIVLLKRYLNKLNPKMVVYEVNAEGFSSDGVESSMDIIANDRNDFGSIKMAFQQRHLMVYNTLIYGFYRDIFNKNKDFKENIVKGGDTYIRGGHVEKALQYNDRFEYTVTNGQKWDFNGKVFKRQLAALEDAFVLLEKQGVKIVLVQAPITQMFYRCYSNNHEFDNKMKNVGTYYNFNDLISLDDKRHYYDWHHLNTVGVRIFNEKLIDLISE